MIASLAELEARWEEEGEDEEEDEEDEEEGEEALGADDGGFQN